MLLARLFGCLRNVTRQNQPVRHLALQHYLGVVDGQTVAAEREQYHYRCRVEVYSRFENTLHSEDLFRPVSDRSVALIVCNASQKRFGSIFSWPTLGKPNLITWFAAFVINGSSPSHSKIFIDFVISPICDPELTYGLPPLLTAATGMDAIAHCIETFLSAAFNPPADGIALDGLRRAWAHIERATKTGSADAEARLNMMSASMQGALAFQKGLGCVHSLSHSLGGVNPKLHHGTLNAMFLPAVIRFNAEAESVQRERKIERLADCMGLRSAEDVAPAIKAMNQKLALPSGLKAMGVTEDLFPKIIQGALADHTHKLHVGEEAGRAGKVRGGAAQQAVAACLRRFHVVNRDRTDD